MCLLALAFAGVSACGRGEEPPSTSVTTTTAGEIDRQRVEEQQQLAEQERQRALQEQHRQMQEQQRAPQEQAQQGEVPSVQDQQHERLRKAEEAKRAERAKRAAKAKQPAKPAAPAEQQAAKKKKAPRTTTGTPSQDEEVVISETTITGAEVEVPPTTLPTPPGAEQPGAMPAVPGEAGAEPYVNRSTVLGDGTSGSYTDGQGTYGGRATWGTGGGLPAYPPAPR